jgi:hypothetical protein
MLGIFSSEIIEVYIMCVRNKTLKLAVLPQAESKRSKIRLAYASVSTVSY